MVRTLFPDPIVEVRGTPWVDVSVSRLNNKKMIHLVNTSGDHKNQTFIEKVAPLPAFDITIRSESRPNRIVMQPQGRELNFSYHEGKVHLKVDPIEIYDILVIE